MKTDRLLSPEDTADYLGVTTETLIQWRYRRQGPPVVRLGHRTVRYSISDLDEWIESRRRRFEHTPYPA